MAARFTTSSSTLVRTATVIDFNSPYTIMAWVYFLSTPGTDQTAVSLNDGSLNSFDLFGRVTGGQTRLTVRQNSGSAVTTTGAAIALNTWYHMAMRRNATSNIDIILNGVFDHNNATNTISRNASTTTRLGEQPGGFASMDGRVAAIKEFSSALTDAEITSEMDTYLPKIADSRLINFTPMLIGSQLKALRGSDWTGSVADEQGPPISWGGGSVIMPFIPSSTGGKTIISSLDSYLQKQIAITSSIDARIQKSIQVTSSLDAQLLKAISLASSLDSLLQKSGTSAAVADAILQKSIQIASNIDAILTVSGTNIVTANLDALLQKLVNISSSLDAVLSKSLLSTSSLDAILAKMYFNTANLDALIQKTVQVGAVTDAYVQKTLNIQSSTDAILARQLILISSVDAILTGATQVIANLDAFIQKQGIFTSASLDAFLQGEAKSVRTRRWNGLKKFDNQGFLH